MIGLLIDCFFWCSIGAGESERVGSASSEEAGVQDHPGDGGRSQRSFLQDTRRRCEEGQGREKESCTEVEHSRPIIELLYARHYSMKPSHNRLDV